MAVTTNSTYHVWQWNCRGFKKKKANLHQHLNNTAQQESYKPDIIALQEVNVEAGLSFYRAFHCRNNSKKVTTLVRREQVTAIHDIETSPPPASPTFSWRSSRRARQIPAYSSSTYTSPRMQTRSSMRFFARPSKSAATAPAHRWGLQRRSYSVGIPGRHPQG